MLYTLRELTKSTGTIPDGLPTTKRLELLFRARGVILEDGSETFCKGRTR